MPNSEITLSPLQPQYRPLERVMLQNLPEQAATLVVYDAEGRAYHTESLKGKETSVTIAGSLGTQIIQLIDESGKLLAQRFIRVDCETAIEDEGGKFQHLFQMLFDTMEQDWHQGYTKSLRIGGKRYKYYVSWLRDHVHALKGMKYFDNDLKTGIELYADSQREDGMIWDKCKLMLHSELQNYRDYEFADGDFIRPIPGNPQRRWQRIPVENDVEYLFLEGLYYTWKACGDTAWMTGILEKAIRAVRYSTSDPYRWSEKFQLLKRGYTIDTWDFQHADDVARSGSSMRVHPDETVFGVMFGDNTGMAAGCFYLAEMLEAAGRCGEAKTYEQLGKDLYERLNALAWNGDFYTHHVSEDPSFKRDVGATDESQQVVQSNAYSINRRLDHERSVAIIQTYQRLKEEKPGTSAGEFYACWPPFEKGFRQKPGDYMNGGVTTICAGELAHGAFENGYERYGTSILTRILDWCERLGGYLHCCLKGVKPGKPERSFQSIDLREVANIDFHGDGAEGVTGWIGQGENDLSGLPVGEQRFEDIPFEIVDPANHNRRAAVGLGWSPGYQEGVSIRVDGPARSIYFLHGFSGGTSDGLVGKMVARYSDGSHSTQYIHAGCQINNWFMPAPNNPYDGGNAANKKGSHLRVGWQGANRKFFNVGLHVYGWNNPYPEKQIATLDFVAAEAPVRWMLAGISRCDAPVWFEEGWVSYGIPDIWGAAALMYALIEGLAGIVDTGVAFHKLRLAPRWESAGIRKARVTAKYPASGGYAAYTYALDKQGQRLELDLACNALETELRLLMPEGWDAGKAITRVNDEEVRPAIEKVEDSCYAVLRLEGVRHWRVTMVAGGAE